MCDWDWKHEITLSIEHLSIISPVWLYQGVFWLWKSFKCQAKSHSQWSVVKKKVIVTSHVLTICTCRVCGWFTGSYGSSDAWHHKVLIESSQWEIVRGMEVSSWESSTTWLNGNKFGYFIKINADPVSDPCGFSLCEVLLLCTDDSFRRLSQHVTL